MIENFGISVANITPNMCASDYSLVIFSSGGGVISYVEVYYPTPRSVASTCVLTINVVPIIIWVVFSYQGKIHSEENRDNIDCQYAGAGYSTKRGVVHFNVGDDAPHLRR